MKTNYPINTSILNTSARESKNKKDNKINFECWGVEGLQTRLGYIKGNYAIHDNGDNINVSHLPSGFLICGIRPYLGSKPKRRKMAYDIVDRLLEAPEQSFCDGFSMPLEFKNYTGNVLRAVLL